VDAALVRAFIAALDDGSPDASGIARVRAGLEILGRPDIRYLVATVRGPGALVVARYARGILEAAGAPTGTPDDRLEDALLAPAGTEVASAGYSLGASRPELGELSRAEFTLLLGLTALAAASRRVVLLVDDGAISDPTLFDAVAADALALVGPAGAVAAALGGVTAGRPVVVVPAPTDAAAPDQQDQSAQLDRIAADRGLALVLARREFSVARRDGVVDVTVAGEAYTGLAPAGDDDPWLVAAGIATALAIALHGIRMRPEWVARGVSAAAAE